VSSETTVGVPEQLRALAERWGGAVRLAPISSAHTIYDRHAYLFAPAFPGAPEAGVNALTLAGRLFSTVMFASDNVIDGDEPSQQALSSADLLAVSFEAYRVLGEVLGGAPRFWDEFRSALATYIQAVGREARYVRGDRLITDFTRAEAFGLAEDKAAVSCVTLYGLAALSGRDGPVADLCASIGSYNVVMQLTDDLLDWRQDVLAGRPSWLLAEVAADAVPPGPDGRWTAADLGRLGQAVFYGGCARRTIELALDKVAEARAFAAPHGVDQWLILLRHLEHRVHAMYLELPGPAPRPDPAPGDTALAGPAQAGPGAVDRKIWLPPAAGAPWRRMAWDTLRWLIRQWGLGTGFPDAKHIMWFIAGEGFTADSDMQIGDVFSRALIATALAEADAVVDGQLADCLDRDVTHLLNRRHPDDPGLWSYFPELPELAADADDLAEILRVLTMTGRDGALAGELDVALGIALTDGAHPDGSFETWLVPAAATDPLAVARRLQAVQKWGTGADCEVVANLVEAVASYHGKTGRAAAHLAAVDRAVTYLASQQRPDGSWPATWYQTDLYGTWVSVRALRRLSPEHTESLDRAASYIARAQLPDGGWSVFSGCDTSDATGTALALLGLADSGRAAAYADATARAQAWLRGAATDNGAGWLSSALIRMDVGRATGLKLPERTFSSPSLTASLVLRAALRFDLLDSEPAGAAWPWETSVTSPARRTPQPVS
jgi:squalene-hopene/tetraprenyl-beta-curcumene cyclase